MRDYGKVASTFWTGETGKRLRKAGRDVQLTALYLITCPLANVIGLYYLPLPTLCHETGLSEEGALKALRRASEGGFAHYDETTELVFVPEMARHQLGETLLPKDNRWKSVVRELDKYRKSRFHADFCKRYRNAYRLPKESCSDSPQSPSKAPSKPLRRAFEGGGPEELFHGEGGAPPSPEKEREGSPHTPLQEKEKVTPPNPVAAAPAAKEPRPRDDLFDAVVEITSADPSVNGAHIGRVCKTLRKADPPYTPSEVRSLPDALSAGGLDVPITLGVVEKWIPYARKPLPRSAPGGKAAGNGALFAGADQWRRRAGEPQPEGGSDDAG